MKHSGLPLNEIMKVARWSNAETFSRFYDKRLEIIDADNFQRAALQ